MLLVSQFPVFVAVGALIPVLPLPPGARFLLSSAPTKPKGKGATDGRCSQGMEKNSVSPKVPWGRLAMIQQPRKGFSPFLALEVARVVTISCKACVEPTLRQAR